MSPKLDPLTRKLYRIDYNSYSKRQETSKKRIDKDDIKRRESSNAPTLYKRVSNL